MATPIYALRSALARLVSLQTGNSRGYKPREFTQAVWNFLHAFLEVPGGVDLLKKYGRYIQTNTEPGTPYHTALVNAQALLKGVNIPPPVSVHGRRFPHALDDLLKATPAKKFPMPIRNECDGIQRVLRDVSPNAIRLELDVIEALQLWQDEAIRVISGCENHHVDSCRRLLSLAEDKSGSFDVIFLNSAMGAFDGAGIQEAAKALVDEIENPPSEAPPEPSIDVTDDLMTIDQLAKLVPTKPKTLRNKKVLGAPATAGGGRGRKARWHYLAVRPGIGNAFGIEMPSLEDAKKINSL